MRRKENRKFLLLCLLMLFLCTSCASQPQNADGNTLEFFNRRVLENPEWTLKAVTELGKYARNLSARTVSISMCCAGSRIRF